MGTYELRLSRIHVSVFSCNDCCKEKVYDKFSVLDLNLLYSSVAMYLYDKIDRVLVISSVFEATFLTVIQMRINSNKTESWNWRTNFNVL